MLVDVNSHYGKDAYWDCCSGDPELEDLASNMKGIIVDCLEQKSSQNCFYFNAQKALAIYGKNIEVKEKAKSDRGYRFAVFFRFEQDECEWLLENPERLLRFQKWVEEVLRWYEKKNLEEQKNRIPLPKQNIENMKLEIGPVSKEDLQLVRQMKIEVLRYWQNEDNRDQECGVYYTANGTNGQMSAPLIATLDWLPLRFRRISFWMPLFVSQKTNLTRKHFGLLNVIQKKDKDCVLVGLAQLPSMQDKNNQSVKDVFELIDWMKNSPEGCQNLSEVEQKTDSPEELMRVLTEAARLKKMLEQPNQKKQEKILSIVQKDYRVRYFLGKKETEYLQKLEEQANAEMQAVTVQKLSGKKYRHTKARTFPLEGIQIFASFLLIVSAYWINAKVLLENQSWIIQISMTPTSWLSQIMIFLAGGLIFNSFKNQR